MNTEKILYSLYFLFFWYNTDRQDFNFRDLKHDTEEIEPKNILFKKYKKKSFMHLFNQIIFYNMFRSAKRKTKVRNISRGISIHSAFLHIINHEIDH